MPTRQIEAALFEKLLDAAPDPIVIIGEQGRIVAVNVEAARKFGYAREELIDQPVEVLVPVRYRHDHADKREAYNAAPRTRPMGMGLDLHAVRKDGTEFPVEISLSPLSTEKGRLVISILRDISERKLAERALREKADELARSNAELEQFAYVASHDLQEPLRAIAGACQLLHRRYKDQLDGEAIEFLGFAVDGAKRMQELINDLLLYSRVTTKARPLVETKLDDVFQQVVANLRAQIEETGAVLTKDALPTVYADQWQLVQLLQNLVSNALKFRKPGATPAVHVGARREDAQWVVSVKDNGIGIAPKYFPKLFVIFKRLHARDEYPGTGIGLASCKKIVERHGGKIWVESAEGQGATFWFTLPDAATSLHVSR